MKIRNFLTLVSAIAIVGGATSCGDEKEERLKLENRALQNVLSQRGQVTTVSVVNTVVTTSISVITAVNVGGGTSTSSSQSTVTASSSSTSTNVGRE